jgi:Na+-translocating ferredoxin:NAD+ oxidoreductase RnfE subunit
MRTAGTQRARDGILLGAGAGLALIVLLVLQSLIGSGLLSTRTATTTATVTALLPAEEYSQVASAYANHLFAQHQERVCAPERI